MIYQFSDCAFHTALAEVHRAGEIIHTEPQVFVVLHYLLEHRDRVVSRHEILEQCWSASHVSDATLTSCLRRVRRTIGQSRAGPTLIATLHRHGYRFVAAVTEIADTARADPPMVAVPPDAIALQVGAPAHPIGSEAGPLLPLPARPTAPGVLTERRHLTVLSWTFAEAKRLTQQMDAEDYYDLLQTVRATMLALLTPYDGHMAQYSEAGGLVYFGYPQAQEDAALRAIHSGLALVETLGRVVPVGLAGEGGLAVQVGIASGMVIVVLAPDRETPPSVAVGSPPRHAVRLGALARPGTVVISATTAQLVAGYFDCKALREQTLTGYKAGGMAYEVHGVSTLQTRFEVGMARGLTPFVGREAELAVLRERWSAVHEGRGQVVVLRGEAGIGKSRLLHTWQAQMAVASGQVLACRCASLHQQTALAPVIEVLQRLLQAQAATAGTDTLAALAAFLEHYPVPLADSLPLLASLCSIPLPAQRYAALPDTPQQQRQRTLDVLVTLVLAQAAMVPLVLIVEDLHWADPATLDFLERLLWQVPTTSLLVVLTCRPLFQAPWPAHTWITPITLDRLTHQQTLQMITQVAGGKGCAADVTAQLAEKADGVPWFVEELTRMVLATGQCAETAAGYELVGRLDHLVIPVTLLDALLARLDHLGPAREIPQWAAVLGREFTYEMIHLVTPHDEAVLRQGLERLVQSELVLQRGVGRQAQYRFKYALVQEAAYQSLRRHLRQACQQRIAQVLADHFPETAAAQPEFLAHHDTEAGQQEGAVPYWQHAS